MPIRNLIGSLTRVNHPQNTGETKDFPFDALAKANRPPTANQGRELTAARVSK